MTAPRLVRHSHPLYRVAPRSWRDPLDATFSMSDPDNRWNTPEFPALYCCCSIRVARENVRDKFRRSSLTIDDLQQRQMPTLVELDWSGTLVDCASPQGLSVAGLPGAYPEGASKEDCRALAAEWHVAGLQGVLARSAAVWRNGTAHGWQGKHSGWSEAAIFVRNARRSPQLVRRKRDLNWLHGSTAKHSDASRPAVE